MTAGQPSYTVTCTIEVPIEAESPEDAALEFARGLDAGEVNLSAVDQRALAVPFF